MKNKITDLRNHLFETIEALKDPDSTMDVPRAKVIANLAQTIINSAKVELDYLELTGQGTASAFLALPAGAEPKPDQARKVNGGEKAQRTWPPARPP